MNIKGLLGNMITTPIRNSDAGSVHKSERTIKSDSAHDRDANGQQSFGEKKQEHGPMSDEQLKKAVEYLENMQTLKDNGWKIELVLSDGKRYLLVKDQSGNLVRRIPEIDLWTLPFDKDVRTGQLLKKSA